MPNKITDDIFLWVCVTERDQLVSARYLQIIFLFLVFLFHQKMAYIIYMIH